MVEEKGLDGAVADKIGQYVVLKGETSLTYPSCAYVHSLRS